MEIPVTFYSYFRELAGVELARVKVDSDATLAVLMKQVHDQFPKLATMDRSTLIAVGVEYQTRDYVLKPGDEVALFPPVQGG